MSEAKVWPVDRRLLIVDDDAPLRMRLARAMETRGFMVSAAENVAEGVELAMENPPAYAVIDLRLDDGNGFEVVQAIQEAKPDCLIVMLTGYGNIATAVAAIKAGAVDYLPKPANADDGAAQFRDGIRGSGEIMAANFPTKQL